MTEHKHKASYVGAPAVFRLEMACQHIRDAFDGEGHFGCYLVGSALERPDWQDVDVRMIMDDDAFAAMFPSAHLFSSAWQIDPKWLLLTTAISAWLRDQTGLPVDFQFQPQTFANAHHKGRRSSLGNRVEPRGDDASVNDTGEK